MFGPNYKWFKTSYWEFFFRKYCFGHTTFLCTFQWTSLEFSLFQIFSQKVSKPTKTDQVENSETSELSKKFFRLFLFWLFDFGRIPKIENSEEKNLESKFWGFRRFQVFHLPLFDLDFSSDRLSFITFCGFFCFLFLLCLNLLFQATGLRISNIQIYVQSRTNKEQYILYLFKVKKAHQIDLSDSKMVFDLNFKIS